MQSCLIAGDWFNVPDAVIELKNDANKDSRSQRSTYANLGSLQLDYYCLSETVIAVKMELSIISQCYPGIWQLAGKPNGSSRNFCRAIKP